MNIILQAYNKEQNKFYFFMLLFTAIYTLLYTIQYQSAWQWGVVDNYFLVERLKDPNFILNDFYTNSLQGFSPRFFVAHFFLLGEKALGIPYEYFVGILNIFRILVVELAIFLIASHIGKSHFVGILTVVFGIFTKHQFPYVPGWFFQTPDLTGQSLALPFALFCFYFFSKNRYYLSCLLLFLAALFHPLVALYTYPLCAFWFVANFKSNTNDDLKKICVFVLPLIYFFISSKLMEHNSPGILSATEYIDIAVKFRHPHHHLASIIPRNYWKCALIFIGSIGFFALFSREKGKVNIFYLLISLYYLLVCFVGWYFVEKYPLKIVGMLGPYRSFSFLIPLYLILLSKVICDELKRNDYIIPLLISVSIVILSINIKWSILFILASMAGLFVVRFFKKAQILFQFKFQEIEPYAKGSLLIAFFALNLYSVRASLLNLKFNVPSKESSFYLWIQHNTKSDAVIWPAQELEELSDQRIRLFAKRAIVIGADFPFIEGYIKEWHERYLDTLADSMDVVKSKIMVYEENKIYEVSKKYKVTNILLPRRIIDSRFKEMNNYNLNGQIIHLYEILN